MFKVIELRHLQATSQSTLFPTFDENQYNNIQDCIDDLFKLLTRVRGDVQNTDRHCKCSCMIQDCVQSDPSDDILWKDFSDLSAENLTNVIPDGNLQTDSSEQSKKVADEIHRIADSLPTYGVTVDVYLWPFKENTDRNEDSYIHYLGSLRRLKDWHNAKFTIIEAEPTADTEFLQRFLSSDVCISIDDVQLTQEISLWRGKVSICNKIENSGLTIPGVCMYKSENQTSTLNFPLTANTTHHKHQAPVGWERVAKSVLKYSVKLSIEYSEDFTLQEGRVGRMLEVLDEINLSSVSALMKTSYSYKICLYQKHPYSQVFLSYIQENDNTGLLARLPIYPGNIEPVCCSETNLSTSVWKENIMTDLQFVQEPEEDLQDNYEFLYFVITSPDKNSSMENHVAIGYMLQHPYHLNGSLMKTIYHKALVPDTEVQSVENDLRELPVMSCDMLRDTEVDLMILRREMLQNWINEKQLNGESTEVPLEELLTRCRDLQMAYLNALADKLPQVTQNSPKLKINLQKTITELSENSFDWPERLIQQYEESQKRSLSRIQSSESVAMSSPIQPCETSTTVDIQSFLKFFHPDGSASNDSLSPVRRRHPSRAQSRMIKPDTNSPNIMSWPENKETLSHDIYYNVDKKSEKINNHLNKLREKIIKDETFSSCLSPIVLFPKCDRKKSVTRHHQQEARRSPRKKSARAFSDTSDTLTFADKKQQRSKFPRLSDTFTPPTTIPEKTKRRYSTSQAPPSQGHMTTQQQELSKRRRSEIGSSKPDLDTSDGDLSKKESRSERHKRRLQEIVDAVLIEAGVDKTDKIFKSCSARLFKVTKLFVMDLPNSRNLKDEMRKIAQNQVQHVIDADKNRMKTK